MTACFAWPAYTLAFATGSPRIAGRRLAGFLSLRVDGGHIVR